MGGTNDNPASAITASAKDRNHADLATALFDTGLRDHGSGRCRIDGDGTSYRGLIKEQTLVVILLARDCLCRTVDIVVESDRKNRCLFYRVR